MMSFLGPYASADDALDATRLAIADLIKAGDGWPSHGNAPLAIAALVASQVSEIKALTEKLDNTETNLRHWREECGKRHGQRTSMLAALKQAKRLTDNINEFGACTDSELYDAAWQSIEAALSKAETNNERP
jgi:hypothetical protein